MGGGCFIKGSLVLMADGELKRIEDIELGEEVLTYNLENSTWGKHSVTEIQVVRNQTGYYIINHKLKISPVHQIFVNGGRKTASQLLINDIIVNGNEITRVTSIEFVQKAADRYNIVLGHNNNLLYTVNGILVFNGW
jgi:hypothetical protein